MSKIKTSDSHEIIHQKLKSFKKICSIPHCNSPAELTKQIYVADKRISSKKQHKKNKNGKELDFIFSSFPVIKLNKHCYYHNRFIDKRTSKLQGGNERIFKYRRL